MHAYPGFQNQLPTTERHLPRLPGGTRTLLDWFHRPAPRPFGLRQHVVDRRGFEPLTSWVQTRRSPIELAAHTGGDDRI